MQRQLDANKTVGEALSGVLVAGQQLLIERVELALIDWRRSFERTAVTVVLLVFGGLILFGALYATDAALIEIITHRASRATALFTCAGWNATLGGGLLLAAARRRQ